MGLRILQATDAGLYSGVVSDSDGAVTSEDVALSVRVSVEPPFNPGLEFGHDDTELTVRWEGEGTLERSRSLAGSWRSFPASRSPYRIPLGSATEFFRLRNPPLFRENPDNSASVCILHPDAGHLLLFPLTPPCARVRHDEIML